MLEKKQRKSKGIKKKRESRSDQHKIFRLALQNTVLFRKIIASTIHTLPILDVILAQWWREFYRISKMIVENCVFASTPMIFISWFMGFKKREFSTSTLLQNTDDSVTKGSPKHLKPQLISWALKWKKCKFQNYGLGIFVHAPSW